MAIAIAGCGFGSTLSYWLLTGKNKPRPSISNKQQATNNKAAHLHRRGGLCYLHLVNASSALRGEGSAYFLPNPERLRV